MLNWGSTAEELLAKFPEIYKHKLFMGEVLYESCNQEQLEVFTFTEEPWSKGYITSIWMRKAKESVCRDSSGGLSDYSIEPVTLRGVKLGDREEKVIEVYGEPNSSKLAGNDIKILTYKDKSTEVKDGLVENIIIYFKINNGIVSSIHLTGDMIWAKKPF